MAERNFRVPEVGSSDPCFCGVAFKNQHSLSEAGRCDAIRKGNLASWERNIGKRLKGIKAPVRAVEE